ncbi:YbaK/EbsC family protein [Crossiella cryophila]|uniref:Prolyl-tRNA editing enzyme YbaK/EbsC (Cys-tRNA(Pro) deacylase) n=1 Tax=Crossiella cryophila TaxID=43355 RepID=A0A7W7CFC4_9PSEU|nr:YbaK/EbsC family protein [Crossiella cryophila]MBB4679937.1 prolyl-tRNA editing enzyme YbaK/EbsC (Cys-tRNA(Pro) deacylase) [Crossiella cryophila]
MHEAVRRVESVLSGLPRAARIRTLTEDVPTAAAAAELVGCPVGAVANSLVFLGDHGPVLIVSSGAHRVDLRKAAAGFGVAKLRRADPEVVLAATGQPVGGVAPIGHPAPLPTLIDLTLADHPELWAGGGARHTLFATTFAELVELTGGTPADIRKQ